MVAPWTRAAPDPTEPVSRAQRGYLPPRVALGAGAELLSGKGDPNGIRRARKGSLFIQRDATPPVYWVNQDGAFTWAPLGAAAPCPTCVCYEDVVLWQDDFARLISIITGNTEYTYTHIGLTTYFGDAGGWWGASVNAYNPVSFWERNVAPWALRGQSGEPTPLLSWASNVRLGLAINGQNVIHRVGLRDQAAQVTSEDYQGVYFRTYPFGIGGFAWEGVVRNGLIGETVVQGNIGAAIVCPGQLLQIIDTSTHVQFYVDGVLIGQIPHTDVNLAAVESLPMREFWEAEQFNPPSGAGAIIADDICIRVGRQCFAVL